MNLDLNSLKDTISNLTVYDVKAAVRKAQNVVMNFTEMEAKVREATNNEPWGASTTLMNEVASGTYNYQQLNEIMPMIYKRFTEKSAEEWRQIYKALQLLEFLVKNGSERVIDDARQHVSTIKMLKQFHFIDLNGKHQGLNVRNRAKELSELLADVERIRSERKKSKAARNKYQGVEGGGGGGTFGGMSGGIGGGSGGGGSSRFGGFGSEDTEFGGYSGGVYGDGGGFGGQTASSTYQDTSRATSRNTSSKFEEYDEEDEGGSSRKPTYTSSTTRKTTTAPPPKAQPKPAPPQEDLFSFGDEPIPAPASKAKAPGVSALDDDFGGFKTGDDDDDFDDFQSPAVPPLQPPPSNNMASFNSIPAIRTLPASSTATFASPQPVSAAQNAGLNDLVGYRNAGSPAPSMTSQASMPMKPMTTTAYQAPAPNYFTSVPTTSSPALSNTLSPTMGSNMTPLTKTNTGSSMGGGAKKGGDAFGSLWNTASMQAGIKKPATPTTPQASMADMAKQKASAGIWGAANTASSSGAGTGSMGSSSGANKGGSGNGLDDLLF